MKDAAAELKLKNESIPRLVSSFAFTTLIALVLNSVYSLTDTLFVSWGVGADASGGISVVFPFVILQSAISTALGGGAASIVSRKLGEGKRGEAGEVVLNAMIAFYATALIITAVGFALMEPLLKVMGVTGDLYAYAKQYFIIILAGNVFSTGFSSIIRAEGKMLYGLLIWVIPITVNIILDAVFILVLGWGVSGSAAATVVCQFTSFSMMVLFFTRFSKLDFKGAKMRISRLGEVLGIGIPSLVQMGSLSLMTLIINNVLSTEGGTLGLNTFAFLNKLITYAAVPFTAVTQALAPIVGYNYGAGDQTRVRKTVAFSSAMCFIYAAVALIIAECLSSYLMMIFTSNAEIIATGAHALKIIAVALIFTPLPMLAGATCQAEGRKLSALALFSLTLIFFLPFVFTLGKTLGVDGVWWSVVLASACSTLAAVIFLLVPRKRTPLAETEDGTADFLSAANKGTVN